MSLANILSPNSRDLYSKSLTTVNITSETINGASGLDVTQSNENGQVLTIVDKDQKLVAFEDPPTGIPPTITSVNGYVLKIIDKNTGLVDWQPDGICCLPIILSGDHVNAFLIKNLAEEHVMNIDTVNKRIICSTLHPKGDSTDVFSVKSNTLYPMFNVDTTSPRTTAATRLDITPTPTNSVARLGIGNINLLHDTLEVGGTLQFTGSQAIAGVLTNDGAGNLTWQPAAGGVPDPLVLDNATDYVNKFNVRNSSGDATFNVNTLDRNVSVLGQGDEAFKVVAGTKNYILADAVDEQLETQVDLISTRPQESKVVENLQDLDIDGGGTPGSLYIQQLDGPLTAVIAQPGTTLQTFTDFQTWLSTSLAAIPSINVAYIPALGTTFPGSNTWGLIPTGYSGSYKVKFAKSITKGWNLPVAESLGAANNGQGEIIFNSTRTSTILFPSVMIKGFGELTMDTNSISSSEGAAVYLDNGAICANRQLMATSGALIIGHTEVIAGIDGGTGFVIKQSLGSSPEILSTVGDKVVMGIGESTVHSVVDLTATTLTPLSALVSNNSLYIVDSTIDKKLALLDPPTIADAFDGTLVIPQAAAPYWAPNNAYVQTLCGVNPNEGTNFTNTQTATLANTLYPFDYTGVVAATPIVVGSAMMSTIPGATPPIGVKINLTVCNIVKISYSICVEPSVNDRDIEFAVVGAGAAPVYPTAETATPLPGSYTCFTLKDGSPNNLTVSNSFYANVTAGQLLYLVFRSPTAGLQFDIHSMVFMAEYITKI